MPSPPLSIDYLLIEVILTGIFEMDEEIRGIILIRAILRRTLICMLKCIFSKARLNSI